MRTTAGFGRKKKLRIDEAMDLNLVITLEAPRVESQKHRPPVCVIPAIDVSRSMGGEKLHDAKQSLTRLVDHLAPGDFCGLVTFADEAELIAPALEATPARKDMLKGAVGRLLEAQGSANLSGGLLAGLEHVNRAKLPPGMARRVIMFSGGSANAGVATESRDILRLLEANQGEATLSAFGYGADADLGLLRDLSTTGKGHYASVKTPEDELAAIARELGGLLAIHARDIQIVVRPAAGARLTDGVPTSSSSFGTNFAAWTHLRDVEIIEEKSAVRMRIPDLLSEEVRKVVLGIHLEPRPLPGRTLAANVEGRYLVEGDAGRPVENRLQIQVEVERVPESEDQRERLQGRREMLELDVKDMLANPDLAEFMLTSGNWTPKLNQKSPFPGDDRYFGTVDLQVRRYKASSTEKYRLLLAPFGPGVVGPTKQGWLFICNGKLLRAASEAEIEILPHLPEDWEEYLVNLTRRSLEHIRGCLLGGAVGDALGAPIEFAKLAKIRSRFGRAGVRDYAPAYGRVGASTDDTQMTLFTAEGLIRAQHDAHGRAIVSAPTAVHEAYLRWLETQSGEVAQTSSKRGWLIEQELLHARRAPGHTCLAALRSGRMGTPKVPLNDSKGCGGVMRIAPAGLIGAPDPFELGCDLAAITHGHPTGYLAAGFLAQLLAEIAAGASLQAAVGSAQAVLERAPGHEETLAAVKKATALACTANGTPEEVESLGGGWIAEEAVAIGLFAALVAKDFEHGVLLAVNHGGDSDSTGSIAGNILGLLYGEAGIPTRWLGELELHGLIRQVAHDLWSHFEQGAQERPDPCPDFDKYPGC